MKRKTVHKNEKEDKKMKGIQPTYDESFKKNIVNLHQNGKTQSEQSREYGVSGAAISRWVKKYAEIKIDEEGTVMTANQVKELQKRLAALEEENQILKKAIAIFTPSSKRE